MNTTIKKILNSTILLWILGSIDILLVIATILLDGSLPKYLFGVDNPKANGDFLTICFSVIGGGAVIYGLYLNNKRIGEQTRQNDIAKTQADIAASNNNDKRFGDAIGYLGSDNTSIVLGGIHILHQLAKEDCRYVPIVAKMYSGYLKDKSEEYYSDEKNKGKQPVIIRAITDILFANGSVFEGEQIDLTATTLKGIQFNKCIQNCIFGSTILENCSFNSGMTNCVFLSSKITGCTFRGGLYKCKFDFVDIEGCQFENIDSNGFILKKCVFITASAKMLTFNGNEIIELDFDTYYLVGCIFNVKTIRDSDITCYDAKSIKFQGTEFINTHIDEFGGIAFDSQCKNIPTKESLCSF